jgi:AraC-like DNA-binding protein
MDIYKKIAYSKIFIDDNHEKSLDLNVISKEACISKYHYLRLFKSIYNKTPHQYLLEKKIDHAKELLKKNYSVTDVCFQLGFESTTSFSKLFKNFTGQSPRDYKKNIFRINFNIKRQPLIVIPGCFMGMITQNSNFE